MRTRKSKRGTQALPAAQLGERISELLAEAPRFADDLAVLTDYSVAACRLRLVALESAGRAHREKVVIDGTVFARWKPGPGPAIKEPPIWLAHQPTYRTYPAINRRDPLVTALFGPAKPAGMLTGILTGEPA